MTYKKIAPLAAVAAVAVGGSIASVVVPSSHKCVSRNGLPDATCTPGATNPQVTQANIKRTICTSGYTATIRPPVSYTTALKRKQIAAYGYANKNVASYEEDHLISLEIGGNPTAPANLWPEPYVGSEGARIKDQAEDRLHREVCAGSIPLVTAQHEIATDWQTAR